MKKYQYIIASVCILLGAVGIAGVYAHNQSEKNQLARQEEQMNDLSQEKEIELVDNRDQKEDLEKSKNEEATEESETPSVDEQIALENENDVKPAETPVTIPQEEMLHFAPENGITWPIDGTTLLDYSMDATIYFPTLNQYQYNPAMVIAGDVNSKVYFVAKGKITNIETNEVTGCTVTQDLGDGYTAIYGQLKELNFEVGDMVEAGQVVGYVSEPTKYYAVEGSNVYFQMLKDGKPIDPSEYIK